MTLETHKTVTLGLAIFGLYACASSQSNRSPQGMGDDGPFKQSVETTPMGATVTAYDTNTPTLKNSCTTPCELTLQTSPTLWLKVEKSGYITHEKPLKNFNPAVPGSINTNPFILGRQGGGKIYHGRSTLKAEIFTPAQKARNDREKARKLEEKKQKEVQIAKALNFTKSVDCTSLTAINDRDMQPIKRVAPIMPRRAEKSAHCLIRFNVNKDGKAMDVISTYCSDPMFDETSRVSVAKWSFTPKLINNRPVDVCGVETKVSYKMMNSSGDLIPE